jgi:hypothetical protein
LDYHEFIVIKPTSAHCLSLPTPIAQSATSESPWNHLLVHQCLGHNSDEVLDTMCHQQSLLGLPKHPFPPRDCPCIICITTKTVHPPRAKLTSAIITKREHLLHIDFSFWNVVSIHSFTSLLSIIDGKDRMLWSFPTASKRPPIQILDFFFTMLQHDSIIIQAIWVDEDGALANSTEFCDFLVECHISLDTTSGYASFLNGEIERPHRTIANMVHAMILNSGLPDTLWCYAAKTATDIYRYTYHSALK